MSVVKAAWLVLVLSTLACAVQVQAPKVLSTPTQVAITVSVKPTTVSTKAWTASVELPTVNVRETPNGRVIGALTAGDLVTIVKCDRSWCQIKPAGYVWRGCLSDNPEGLECVSR